MMDAIIIQKTLKKAEDLLASQNILLQKATESNDEISGSTMNEHSTILGDNSIQFIDLNGVGSGSQSISADQLEEMLSELNSKEFVPVLGNRDDPSFISDYSCNSRQEMLAEFGGSSQIKTLALKLMWPQILVALMLYALMVVSLWIMRRSQRLSQSLMVDRNNMISNLTHELKTPISTISVALEAIENFEVINDKEKSLSYIRTAREVVHQLSGSVDKVMQFVILDHGSLDMDISPFDLRQVCEQVLDVLAPQMEAAGIRATLEGQQSIIKADQGMIRSVMVNLIDNAIKYGKAGGEIAIVLEETGTEVCIRIEDNGMGIQKAEQVKVFNRFYRVAPGDGHNVKGQGLGLSYVKEIVEAHGGAIHLQSSAGEGSTFEIILKK